MKDILPIELLQMCALHIGQHASHKNGTGLGILNAINYPERKAVISNKIIAVKNICLHKKPLEAISNEDLLKAFEIYNPHLPVSDRLYAAKYLLKEVKNDMSTLISPLETLAIFDYLRSKGYALSYGAYSVEQLVESGVYKLI